LKKNEETEPERGCGDIRFIIVSQTNVIVILLEDRPQAELEK
jgi:hypothetical protein